MIKFNNWRIVFHAGMAGGMAEIAWVAVYSRWTGVDALEVARQVTATLFPFLPSSFPAVTAGIMIHLLLSLLLAWAVTGVVIKTIGDGDKNIQVIPLCLSMLFLVWGVNFLIILPVINPDFLALMPLAATCFSKLLFGAAMAMVLWRGNGVPRPAG